MELDHEKFEGVKELAEISIKISQGTAALAALKGGEAAYLTEREQRLVERLKQALVDSSDLIQAIGENHSALVGYKTELVEFHSDVLSLVQGVTDCISFINDASSDLESRMEKHDKQVSSFKEATQREWVKIGGERNQMTTEREQLAKAQHLLNDRQAMFERTLARTKK